MVATTLTPLKRWQAARRLDSGFMLECRFIMIGMAVAGVTDILKMNEERLWNSMIRRSQCSLQPDALQRSGKRPTNIIENIGEVKHTETTEKGFSMAIELTGLSELNLNELIRTTNVASVKKYAKVQEIPVSENSNSNKNATASKIMVRQGV